MGAISRRATTPTIRAICRRRRKKRASVRARASRYSSAIIASRRTTAMIADEYLLARARTDARFFLRLLQIARIVGVVARRLIAPILEFLQLGILLCASLFA